MSTLLLDGISNAIDSSQQLTLLSELSSTLLTESAAIKAGSEEMESTLFVDPFPILDFLCPLLRTLPSISSVQSSGVLSDHDKLKHETRTLETIKESLNLLANYSSAKEMMMGLGERLSLIGPRRADDNGSESNSDEAQDEEEEEVWEGSDAMRESMVLIDLYGAILPRIVSPKPLKFLNPAIDSILSTLTTLAENDAFYVPSDVYNEPSQIQADVNNSVKMIQCIIRLIFKVRSDRWIIDQDLTLQPLQHLLLDSISHLRKGLNSNIAERYFTNCYERYRIPGRETQIGLGIEEVWEEILSVARSLSLDPQTLLSYCSPTTISQPAVLEPAHSSTSAFLLLTHSIFHLPHLRASFLGNHSSTELLRMNLGSIMIALGGAEGRGGRGGEDETLFWCWWCIQNAIKDGEFISEEMLFTLIKLLSTTAALSPIPSIRFLAFRLVSTLIIRTTEKEEIQMMILKDLLVDCPHEAMRIAASGILREILIAKLDSQVQDNPSIFASPLLLDEFSTALLSLDTPTLLSTINIDGNIQEVMEVKDFLQGFYKSTLEKLTFYYFLLVRDSSNLTGIHSQVSLSATASSLLDPLTQALAQWISSLELKLSSATDNPQDIEQLNTIVSRGGEESENYRARAECEILLQSLERVKTVIAAR